MWCSTKFLLWKMAETVLIQSCYIERHLAICSDFGSHYLSNRYFDEHHIWHAHREHFCVLCDAARNSYYKKWPNSAYSKLLPWAMAKNWEGCSEFLKNLVEHVSGCTYHFLTEWDINIFRHLTFKSPKYKIWWTSVKLKSSRYGACERTSVSQKSKEKFSELYDQ